MSKRPSTFKGMLMKDRETLLNILDKLKTDLTNIVILLVLKMKDIKGCLL